MRKHLFRGGGAIVVVFSMLCAGTGRAGTIIEDTDPTTFAPDISSYLEGNTLFENLGYTDFSDPNISNLGLDPGTFLFEPNNFFDFTGDEILTILEAYVDPSQNSLPLDSPGSVLVTFTVPDNSGDVNSMLAALPADTQDAAPEPGAGYLLGGGLTAMFLLAAFRDRRMRRALVPIKVRSRGGRDRAL